jgi:hypothetical protein
MNKKKICILISGQSRTSPFSTNNKYDNNYINDYFLKNILNDEFKSKYDYKVYLSADDIDINKFIEIFKIENIGNLHLINKNYYLNEINNKILDSEYYLTKYRNQDFNKCRKYDKSIHQHYKILDCFNLYRNDKNFKNVDYIIRIRLDCIFKKNICNIINDLNNKVKIIMQWDHFAIGHENIMTNYCTGLENKYGTYCYKTIVPAKIPFSRTYNSKNKERWQYSAERQLFEQLFEFCNLNNYNINDTIKIIPHRGDDRFCKLIRFKDIAKK